MCSEMEEVEERLKSFLSQLRTEHDIFDRMVYKNKNQHRRGFYFQHLIKVRRDLRLVQSAKLKEILNDSFDVITDKRPRQKVQLLESLKRRRRGEGGKFNFLERLQGVARLLSQMVEPILKAATEISTLLARSFFVGFSLTILSLLARLRVLVQQILLDVVYVFNAVSDVSRKGQSVKLNQDGIQVLRECYPIKEQLISLECVWKSDKYLLVEKTNECEEENTQCISSRSPPIIKYQSIEAFLGVDEPNDDPDLSKQGLKNVEKNEKQVVIEEEEKVSVIAAESSSSSDKAHTSSSLQEEIEDVSSLNPLKRKFGGSKDKVAFISIKKPVTATTNSLGLGIKSLEENDEQKEDDPFFSLLMGGITKTSLF